jgi:Raf kinase inhibitor-like YbhB/YbcL family protein
MPNIRITSSEFGDSQVMPLITICTHSGGQNYSPSLQWTPVKGAKSYALFCYDPDTPTGVRWIHWVIYSIPESITRLPLMHPIRSKIVKLSNRQMIQGLNSNHNYGWDGPCPPQQNVVHRYHFKIYALNTVLDASVTRYQGDQSERLMRKFAIASGELIGTFTNL